MTAFNNEAIADTILSGSKPADWIMYRGQTSYFIQDGAVMVVATVVLLSFPLGVFISLYPHSWLPDPVWNILIYGVLGCGGLAALAGAVYIFVQASSAPKRWIALTPEGVVEYHGPRRGISFSVAYAEIVSLKLAVSGGSHVRFRSPYSFGAQMEQRVAFYIARRAHRGSADERPEYWRIQPWYLQPMHIAQAIIEAHTRYTATHTQRQTEEA